MREYNVFISYKTQYNGKKTKDSEIAQEVYNKISVIDGVYPFLDVEELHNAKGSSDFGDSIFEALSTAKIFIYVCTNAEYLRTPYIESEWTTYLGELNSGRKPRGSIFGITENIRMEDIPVGLRKFEMIPFSQENLCTLVKFISNRITILSEKRNSVSAIENWMMLRQEEIEKQEFLYRNTNVSIFLDEFLEQHEYSRAFIRLDKKYRNSVLFHAEVLRLREENNVLFFDSFTEARRVLAEYIGRIEDPMDGSKRTLVFIEQLQSTNEYRDFERLANYFPKCKFICAAYEGVVRCRLGAVFSTIIHMPNNHEMDILIHTICQDIGYPCSNALIDQFMLPVYEDFRTPVLIGLVIRQLKENQITSYDGYNELLFYELLDDYLDSLDSEVSDLIFQAVEICSEKGINYFLKKEIGENDLAFALLEKYGILESARNGYVFSCEDYLIYKTAENIALNHGTKCIEYLLNHDLEECIPFCISIMIQKYNSQIPFRYLGKLRAETIERLLDLFLISPQLPEIIEQLRCFDVFCVLLYRYLDRGYSQIVRDAIDNLCKMVYSYTEHMEIRQLRMIANYYIDGTYEDCENKESVDYWIYKGLIHYYADQYDDAETAFEQALHMSQDKQTLCRILMNYVDVLVDTGKIFRLNSLLDEYQYIFYNLQEYENYYIYKGNVSLARLNIQDAHEYYAEALNKMQSYYKANTVARIYGNLGLVEYYRGNPLVAEKYFQKNQDICLDSANANGIAISRQYLCLQKLFEERFDEAYSYISAAMYYARRANNSWRINQIHFMIDHFFDPFDENISEYIADIERIPSPQYHSDSFIMLIECMLRRCSQKEKIMSVISRAKQANLRVDCKLNEEIISIYQNLLNQIPTREPQELKVYLEYAKRLVTNYSLGRKMYVTCKPLPFSKYCEFESERLSFKHISGQYASGIYDFASRTQPTKYVLWKRHEDLVDTYSYIEYVQRLETSGEYMLWVIVEKNGEKVIGTIDLNYEEDYNGVEFGIMLSDFYWHKGFADESLKRIIRFAEMELNLSKLVGVCVNGNNSSQKLMERNGFVYNMAIEDYHNISGLPDRRGLMFIRQLENNNLP